MTTKMISEETLQPQAQEETRITPRDLRRVFWRSFQMEFSWNYERQMNLAFVYALIPVLKKLYPRREELAAALKRHLVFFNTTPHIVTLLLGITTAMEEKNSQQKNMDATAIDNVKASLMGPLAGLGDSFFWGTLRLIATGIGTSLALKGNIHIGQARASAQYPHLQGIDLEIRLAYGWRKGQCQTQPPERARQDEICLSRARKRNQTRFRK